MTPAERANLEYVYDRLYGLYESGDIRPGEMQQLQDLDAVLRPLQEAEAAQYEAETQPMLMARDPSIVERVQDFLAPAMSSLPGMDARGGQRLAGKAAGLLDITPFVGGGMSAGQAVQDARAGDYGSAAANLGFAAMDIVPGVAALRAGRGPIKSGLMDFLADESGALKLPMRADPAIQRAEEVLGLLRSGREDSVTDQMLDMGDPVLNARMNEHLFNNYDLPMDAASRSLRAGEMGRNTSAFRGTMSDETSARDRQFVSQNPDVTQSFAGHIGFADEVSLPPELAQVEGGNIMPLSVDPSRNTSMLKGYELLLPGSDIRSRFARFDPRLAHLRNLNASLAAAGVPLGLLAMQPDEEQY
jgi:hypothetical protein